MPPGTLALPSPLFPGALAAAGLHKTDPSAEEPQGSSTKVTEHLHVPRAGGKLLGVPLAWLPATGCRQPGGVEWARRRTGRSPLRVNMGYVPELRCTPRRGGERSDTEGRPGTCSIAAGFRRPDQGPTVASTEPGQGASHALICLPGAQRRRASALQLPRGQAGNGLEWAWRLPGLPGPPRRAPASRRLQRPASGVPAAGRLQGGQPGGGPGRRGSGSSAGPPPPPFLWPSEFAWPLF